MMSDLYGASLAATVSPVDGRHAGGRRTEKTGIRVNRRKKGKTMKPTSATGRILALATTVAVLGVWSVSAQAQCCARKRAKAAAAVAATKAPQTTCPVMGGKVNRKQYADVKGYRVYVCCPGCVAKIKADPDKYLAAIKAKGETPAKAPVLLCKGCGQVKGSAKCCDPKAKKCGGCGIAKRSPGCCK